MEENKNLEVVEVEETENEAKKKLTVGQVIGLTAVSGCVIYTTYRAARWISNKVVNTVSKIKAKKNASKTEDYQEE